MSHWVLLVAPLVLASFVMLFGFVGCKLNTQGLGNGNGNGNGEVPKYVDVITGDTDCVSYWRLGDPVGETKAADSKDGNDGTYNGGVTLGVAGLVKGDTDTAAQFDGSTGYVSVPHNDNSLNPAKFTVEALVDLSGGDGQRRVVVASTALSADLGVFGYALYANAENNWEASVGDGASSQVGKATGPAVTPGTHYLAMTYNGTTLKLYVDPKDDTPAPADVFYEPNLERELRIGAGGTPNPDAVDFLNGVIDEVAIYNVDLDFDRIQKHFALATTGALPPK